MNDSTTANGLANVPEKEAVEALNQKKSPPPEHPESIWRRRYIILSFWAVVIFLGLPIWWKTTTVYRASLPLQQMLDWADGNVCLSAFSANLAC
jgi:phosphatidylinositol glycan class S